MTIVYMDVFEYSLSLSLVSMIETAFSCCVQTQPVKSNITHQATNEQWRLSTWMCLNILIGIAATSLADNVQSYVVFRSLQIIIICFWVVLWSHITIETEIYWFPSSHINCVIFTSDKGCRTDHILRRMVLPDIRTSHFRFVQVVIGVFTILSKWIVVD